MPDPLTFTGGFLCGTAAGILLVITPIAFLVTLGGINA